MATYCSPADAFDHWHDTRKHDTPPSRSTPLFEQNPSAYQIAALIQGLAVADAADLIERYADMKAAAAKVEEARLITQASGLV